MSGSSKRQNAVHTTTHATMNTNNPIMKTNHVRWLALPIAMLAFGFTVSIPTVLGANEKGPRCNDGIDNDGDGLVDCDDSDCNCGGGDDGGGSGNGVICITFDDLAGDSVRGDGGGSYCHDPKGNVLLSFSNDGHLGLDTEVNKKGGRSIYVDFGFPVQVVDAKGKVWEFQTTDELDAAGIKHDVNLFVGPFQDNFDMLAMTENEVRADVNLWFNLSIQFPGKNNTVAVFVKMAPTVLDNDRQCEISDPVKVTCTTVDGSGAPIEWHVETQDPYNLACVSQDPFGHMEDDLSIGLLGMSFGFTVTR